MVEMEVRKVTKGVESNMVAFDFERTPITQIADYIIITASNNGTSDIHFDPREDGMMVRFRVDGDLQDYTYIPKLYERNLTTRLKLLANMNITESRLPQDGAIKGEFGGKYLDMRVSCLPLNTGEKIVIRILDYTRSLQGIDNLGFNQTNLKKIKRMMGVPNGIILITGATGSGKSTTVYSILQGLNRPEINIITVEDPIEMNIEGMNQVQVNAEIGMTFAAALRSILRQDPNVILIGEIRDSETAQIAVRASITGHLVLSTIHTNNSLATIERLLDMDVERYLMSTALTGIVSQRLGKQLCMSCRVERETTKYEKKVFKKFMNRDIEKIYDANHKGCENCRNGYKGRIAIHEVLELDDDIRNAISNPKIKKEELAEMVYSGKTISMLQDALGKAISGLTSFEEVYRVIEMESDPEDDVAYLTKSLDDDEDENKTKEELATDSLDEDTNTLKDKTGPIIEPLKPGEVDKKPEVTTPTTQEPPKVNADGKEIRDIKDLIKDQNTQTTNKNTPAQQTTIPPKASTPPVVTLTPEQQKAQQAAKINNSTTQQVGQQATPGTLPQVATLTPEEAKVRAQAEEAKKAQETAANTKKEPEVPLTLLTAEEAKAQAEEAKQKYDQQKTEENEKKIIDFLSKPDPNATKKKKLVIAKPNITPTAVTATSTPQQKTKQPQPQQQEGQLEQKPQVLVKQAPTVPPQPEKIENPIPELNISIKTDKNKPLIPSIDDSPINKDEETVFDEKNKVEAIDINKISKSTDLQKDKEIINNPLIPTIKDDNKKQSGMIPVIIDTFDTESDIKKTPQLTEIKKDELKNLPLTNNTTPEITKVIDEPLIINSKKVQSKETTPPTSSPQIRDGVTNQPTIKPVESKTQAEQKNIINSENSVTDTKPKFINLDDNKTENKEITKHEPKLISSDNPNAENKAKVVIKTDGTKVLVKPVIKTDTKTSNESNTENKDKFKVLVKPDGTKVLVKPVTKTDTKTSNESSTENKDKFKVLIKPDGTKVLVKPVIKSNIKPSDDNKKDKVAIKPITKNIDKSEVVKSTPTVKTSKENKDEVKPTINESKKTITETPTNEKKDINVEEKQKNVVKQKEIKIVPTTPKKQDNLTTSIITTPLKETETTEKKPTKTLVKPITVTRTKAVPKNEKNKTTLEIKNVTRKNDLNEISDIKDNDTFITSPTNETNNSAKLNEKTTFDIPEINYQNNNDKQEEIKQPLFTEMKSSFELPKVTKSEKKSDRIESTPEKKPFITEMKSSFELPKITPTKKEDEKKEVKKEFVTEINNIPKAKDEKIENEEKQKINIESVTEKETPKEENSEDTKQKDSLESKMITKPSINIFEETIDTSNKNIEKTVSQNTEVLNLDIDIDGELTALGED